MCTLAFAKTKKLFTIDISEKGNNLIQLAKETQVDYGLCLYQVHF
jgi:hypothetical protein